MVGPHLDSTALYGPNAIDGECDASLGEFTEFPILSNGDGALGLIQNLPIGSDECGIGRTLNVEPATQPHVCSYLHYRTSTS